MTRARSHGIQRLKLLGRVTGETVRKPGIRSAGRQGNRMSALLL